ncbi:hypothetical protein [Bacillus pumilus]|nr:hypothetical protein [Bacillus pumilus]
MGKKEGKVNGGKIMVGGELDEVGLMVRKIDEKG